jgi:predicted SprT family Zn-dependent metalloprotease
MKALKNTTSRNAKMLKMDNDIYQLRRKVMNVLYDIKGRGYNIPRVEVRVVSEDTEACAYAYLGKNVVHFNRAYMNRANFTQIVLHEVVHASFGVGEIVGCKLMHCTEFWKNNVDEATAWKLFEEYYRNNTNN